MDSQRWKNVGHALAAQRCLDETCPDEICTDETRAYAIYPREQTQELPREILLQVSNRCNPRHAVCGSNIGNNDPKSGGRPAFFRPGLFQRLRPIFPTLLRAHFYSLGEPILSPHLTGYFRELSSAGVETWLTTHLTMIDRDKAEAFARAGVDRISLSIDAATWQAIRRGARFDHLLRGLQALSDARLRHGRPRLTLNFIAMRSELDELLALVDLCSAFGIEEINIELRSQALDFAGYRAVMEPCQQLAEAAGIHLGTRFLAPESATEPRDPGMAGQQPTAWFCSEPWATVYVTVAGEVQTCDLNGESFGNLFEAPFEDIWNGDSFVEFRDQHRVPTDRRAVSDRPFKKARLGRSSSFEALEPVSHRVLQSLNEPPPLKNGLAIERPCEGEMVTDPLVITGRLPSGTWFQDESPGTSAIRSARHGGARARGKDHRLLLYIDRTPVSDLEDAVTADGSFLLVLPVPFLSEGAHVLSMGFGEPGKPAEPGWSRRTFHFRQSPEGQRDAIAVTRTAAVLLTLNRPAQSARVWIDGEPWSPVEWFCGLAPWCREKAGTSPSLLRRALMRFDRRAHLVWRAGVALALDGLAPGRHAMEIRPRRQGAHTVLLERLAVER